MDKDGYYIVTQGGAPAVEEVPGVEGKAAVVCERPDLATWLQQHPYLDTSEPESVSVGGVEGEKFEAVVSRLPKDKAKFCEAACVPLFALNNKFGFHFYMDESELIEKVQFIVLDDVKGETVVIYLLSDPQAQLEEFGAKAQEVIDTIEWTGE